VALASDRVLFARYWRSGGSCRVNATEMLYGPGRPSVRVTAPLLFNSAPLRAWIPRNAVWSSTNSKNEGRRLAAVFVCVACRLTSSLKTDLANCHPDCTFCAIGLSVSVCSPRSYFSVFGLYQLCIARTVSPQRVASYHDSDSYHIAPPVTIKLPCC